MRIDRPPSRPEEPGEGDGPSAPERPVQEARPRLSEMRDDNGLNAAEYIAAWNKKVESGEAEREQAAEERPRRDVDLRDSNGMTAAELRFQRNKEIDEAEAETSAADGGGVEPPPRRSAVTDAQGRTGAELRFQQAKRVEEAAKARAAEISAEEPEEGDARPEFNRELRTVTEELGESKTWRSFSAAKREIRARLGHEPGIQVDHVVEQCQEARSGFTGEQINSSDNMVRLDGDVHKEKTRRYASHVPGTTIRLRDMLDGESWEEQHQTGMETLREEMEKRRDDTDD